MKKALFVVSMLTLTLYALTLSSTRSILSAIGEAIKPLFYGVFFALVLKSPVGVLEKTLFRKEVFSKIKRPLSIAITLLFSGGFIALITVLIVPELKNSFVALQKGVEWFLSGGVEQVLGGNDRLAEWLKKGLGGLAHKVEEWLPTLIEKLSTTLKGVVQLFLGLMLGITMLASGKKDLPLLEKWSITIFGEKKSEFLKGATSALSEKFSRYLAGSLLEAVIFATICYVVFLIFKIPYALLVAVVVGLFNLIPTLGGYLGGGIGALIILTVSPEKALAFILITFILQQVEQVTTYPVVVGKYLGLNAFMVLVAVVVGGGLFGFWGLILGVPVFAFLYNLISVILTLRTKKDNIQEKSK